MKNKSNNTTGDKHPAIRFGMDTQLFLNTVLTVLIYECISCMYYHHTSITI